MQEKILIAAGVNHFKSQGSDLRGCLNDVANMAKRFSDHGYYVEMMKDKEASTENFKKTLKEALSMNGVSKVVVHGSFHGTQMQSTDPLETDLLDEAICLWDFDDYWDNPFTDNVFAELLKNKKKEIEFMAIFDCCHSRTMTRNCDSRPRFVEPPEKYAPDVVLRINRMGIKQHNYGVVDKTMNHVCMSACRANQTASDAYINGIHQGAYTYSLGKALDDLGGNPSKEKVYMASKTILKSGRFSQVPGIEGPKELLKGSFY